jgi:hypothetical protein
MSRGFNKNVEVEFELPRADIDKLLKEYKKIKKYQKSSMYAIKSIDGTEKIVSSLIREAEENPID